MSPIAYRELYAPAHFGNSYEVMYPRELRDCLAEWRFWGFNAYGDWFDSADLCAPWVNPRGHWLLPQELFERKITHLRSAADLGFRIDLCLTPNHVYLDQLRAEWLADTRDPKHFGQLLCPSKPAARQVIVDNHRRLFRLLHDQGVPVASLSACPYDYGGCGCQACQPWIVTFGRLYLEIVEAARTVFPDVAPRLVGWWWTPADHAAFKAWADAAAPGTFPSLARWVQYGTTTPDLASPLPAGCESHAFVHIGYCDVANPPDRYGPWGPVVAARRLEPTVRNLESAGVTGFMAYSEGVLDDVNKAILAGLASGQFASADEVLGAYAERYFGAQGQERHDWVAWLARWGRPFEVDPVRARETFDRLAPRAKPGWRLEQFASKLRLFEAHVRVGQRDDWDMARLAAAERFFAEREHLQRQVWGLGLVRHALHERYFPPPWLDSWCRHTGKPAPGNTKMPAGA